MMLHNKYRKIQIIMAKHHKVQIAIFAKQKNNLFHLSLLTNERRGSFWQNVTGSVDPGEDFETAAKREVLEETGIEIKKKHNFFELDTEYEFIDQWNKDVLEKCFALVLESQTDVIIDSSEHQDFKWLPVNKIDENYFKYPSNYEVFKESMERIK